MNLADELLLPIYHFGHGQNIKLSEAVDAICTVIPNSEIELEFRIASQTCYTALREYFCVERM